MTPFATAPRTGMSEAERRRLAWMCRRGMRELDVVLSAYLAQRYGEADSRQQAAFRRLLECQDPVIFAYLTGSEEPPDAPTRALLQALRGDA